jgi:hypothetical protein
VCRLSIDLKGVLRFIAAAKEDPRGQQDKLKSPEFSVVHILVAALSQVLAEEKTLTYRRCCIPWLGIDVFFRNVSDAVGVSIIETDCPVVTIHDARNCTIEEIADYFSEAKRKATTASHSIDGRTSWRSIFSLLDYLASLKIKEFGQCLVILGPSSEECAIDVDVTDLPVGVTVALVLGGIKLVRDATSSSTATFTDSTASPVTPPKPVLSLSLTINAPVDHIDSCRRFAERLQQLVQNPELCNKSS